jgi:hypothetical protein
MGTREQARRNSVLIREVNERITDISPWHDGEAREVLCECGDRGCIEAILVTQADYRAARKHPSRYLVTADHGTEAKTRLLTTRDGYSVVEYGESAA